MSRAARGGCSCAAPAPSPSARPARCRDAVIEAELQVEEQPEGAYRSKTGRKWERTVMVPRLPKQSQKSMQSQKSLFEAEPEVEARERTKVVCRVRSINH
jgi:hypothetical protein